MRENMPGGVHLMMFSGHSTVPKILNTGSTIVSHKIKVSEERWVAVVSGTRYWNCWRLARTSISANRSTELSYQKRKKVMHLMYFLHTCTFWKNFTTTPFTMSPIGWLKVIQSRTNIDRPSMRVAIGAKNLWSHHQRLPWNISLKKSQVLYIHQLTK